MAREDPIDVLTRWRDHGADWRALELRDDRAVVELLTCYGEPVDRIESADPHVIAFLRAHPDARDRQSRASGRTRLTAAGCGVRESERRSGRRPARAHR